MSLLWGFLFGLSVWFIIWNLIIPLSTHGKVGCKLKTWGRCTAAASPSVASPSTTSPSATSPSVASPSVASPSYTWSMDEKTRLKSFLTMDDMYDHITQVYPPSIIERVKRREQPLMHRIYLDIFNNQPANQI